MSFPKEGGAGQGVMPDGTKKGIALRVTGAPEVFQDPTTPIIFSQVVYNDGMSHNPVTGEVTINESGKVMITAQIGGIPQDAAFTLTVFVFKNGVPLRQNNNVKDDAPYTIADLSVQDKCELGDVYRVYGKLAGADLIELEASNGVTGFEITYL